LDVDHDLAGGVAAFERAIRFAKRRQREMAGIDARATLPASISRVASRMISP
jgi:hypothetical protein